MLASLTLIDAAVIGPMRHQVGRTLLAIVAIALGVALGLAIYLINRTAADEISLASRSLYGLADLSILGNGADFDEDLYPQVARAEGIAVASPKLEIEAKLADRSGTITIIGIDAFRHRELHPSFARQASEADSLRQSLFNPNAVIVSPDAARSFGVGAGDRLALQVGLQVVELEIAGVLPSLRDRAALMDIGAAQYLFGRLGRLSGIDVRLRSGAVASEVRARLAQLAVGQTRITTPGEATDEALRLSRAYRANLTALALVALFTGGFFVYSTQSLAVLRRRRELALLHAIGVTRNQQLGCLLLGSAILGLFGAALGVALGVLLARVGVQALGSLIGAGYYDSGTSQIQIQASEIVGFCVLGILAALMGAARPALDGARIPTAAALKAQDVASGDTRVRPWLILLLFVASCAVLSIPPVSGLPLPGYVSIALLLIACVAAMPSLVRVALGLLPALRRPTYEVATAALFGTARYAALSVSAIVVSFSLMVAMAIMVSSFRHSLDAWTQKILPADLYVRVGGIEQTAHMDEATVQRLSALDGIARVETSRLAQAVIDPERAPVVLSARSFDSGELDDSLWIRERIAQPAPSGTTPIWISESVVDLFGLRPGDQVDLVVRGRRLQAFVQGTWRDYEHQNGAVVVSRDAYVKLTGDRAINTAWLWLAPNASRDTVRDRIRETMPAGVAFDLRVPAELRQMSLRVFDRTFAITYILELVAVVIGLFGIASGISAQVLARRGELGALRHIGFTRRQIASMLAIEGAVLGTIGVVIGLAIGTVVSFILIYVVNRQSFHWSMDLHAPIGLLVVLSAVLIASAALIAMWSGRRATGSDVVAAVREDW